MEGMYPARDYAMLLDQKQRSPYSRVYQAKHEFDVADMETSTTYTVVLQRPNPLPDQHYAQFFRVRARTTSMMSLEAWGGTTRPYCYKPLWEPVDGRK